MPATDVRRYRWSRGYGLRAAGGSIVLLAVLWLIAAIFGFAIWSVVLLALGAVLAVGCLVFLVIHPPVLLEVSSDGYQVHHVRGAGVTRARWSQVQSVEGGTSPAGKVMTIALIDGASTTVPMALLGSDAVVAERDVYDRLNAAFGYRRLGGR